MTTENRLVFLTRSVKECFAQTLMCDAGEIADDADFLADLGATVWTAWM